MDWLIFLSTQATKEYKVAPYHRRPKQPSQTVLSPALETIQSHSAQTKGPWAVTGSKAWPGLRTIISSPGLQWTSSLLLLVWFATVQQLDKAVCHFPGCNPVPRFGQVLICKKSVHSILLGARWQLLLGQLQNRQCCKPKFLCTELEDVQYCKTRYVMLHTPASRVFLAAWCFFSPEGCKTQGGKKSLSWKSDYWLLWLDLKAGLTATSLVGVDSRSCWHALAGEQDQACMAAQVQEDDVFLYVAQSLLPSRDQEHAEKEEKQGSAWSQPCFCAFQWVTTAANHPQLRHRGDNQENRSWQWIMTLQMSKSCKYQTTHMAKLKTFHWCRGCCRHLGWASGERGLQCLCHADPSLPPQPLCLSGISAKAKGTGHDQWLSLLIWQNGGSE